MAYVAVNEDKKEFVFDGKPRKWEGKLLLMALEYNVIELPKGSIEKLIGKKLTWEDEPVELQESTQKEIDIRKEILDRVEYLIGTIIKLDDIKVIEDLDKSASDFLAGKLEKAKILNVGIAELYLELKEKQS